MNENNSIWDNFINKYNLSKTIRFELKPVGKTIDFIKENGLIEEDKQREKDFNEVKKIMDEYYVEFIENCLKNIKLDLSDLQEYYTIYFELKKDKYNSDLKKQFKNIQKKIANNMYQQIKDVDNFNNIFDEKFVNVVLPKWLKEKGREQDEMLLSKFKKWTTYFDGFFNNRQNVLSNDLIPTSIFYRIVVDNLPIFLDNIAKYDKLKKINGFPLESIEKNFAKYLNNVSLDYFFSLENFNNLLNQEGIDLFNLILGGYVENNSKICGLNESINLYSQKPENKETSKQLKQLIMMPLYKQILTEKKSFSEKFGIIQDNQELVNLIDDIYTNNYVLNFDNLQKLIKNLNEYDLNQIYVNTLSLQKISKSIFKDLFVIRNGLKEFIKNKEHIKSDKKSEKKLEEILNQKYFSIFEIQEGVKLLKLSKEGNSFSDNFMIDYFLENINDKLFENIKNNYNQFKSINVNHLTKITSEDIQTIKTLLDSLKELFDYIKPLYVNLNIGTNTKIQEAYNLDSLFYIEFNKIYNAFSVIIPTYNKVRNYVTKKQKNVKKFKLNFNCPVLLKGWDVTKEPENHSVLFRKDGDYYLGIMPKGHTHMFSNIENIDNDGEYYEKMVYKQISDASKDIQNLFVKDNKTQRIVGRKEKEGDNKGKNVELENARKKYLPEDIQEIKKKKSYLRSSPSFNEADKNRFIDYYKERVIEYYQWFNFKFKESEEYLDFNDFIKDVDNQGYKIEFIKINEQFIMDSVNTGKLYLFQIYNKDFSKNKCESNKNSKPNLHTIYWEELFSEENLKDVIYKLNGEGEIFYRECSKAIPKEVTHPKNIPITNKNPINNKQTSIFPYDLIKDKRYTEDKFLFHCPITINFKQNNMLKGFNQQIISYLKENNVTILSIDRGERHLLYYTLLDLQGNIIKSGSLNLVSDDVKRQWNYHDLLDQREKERDKARKDWMPIEAIKNLKEGYLSKIIHDISKMVIENNSIIILEDLNFGFKNGRFKIEKQVYQKFEKMLIDKLNYLVFKDKPKTEVGGSLKGYQLTDKFVTFNRLKKQSGILFYVDAKYTSAIDPTTGFFDMIYPSYTSVDNSIALFKKFNYIKYNTKEDLFEFNFNFSKFNTELKLYKDNWSIWSNGVKLVNYRNPNKNNEWETKEVIVNNQLKKLFGDYKINYDNDEDLIPQIISNTTADFHKQLIENLKLVLKLRNSRINSDDDYILSCVKNKDGVFFDSRESSNNLPKNGDENGAYNIGIKGIILLNKIRENKEIKKITKEEYINYLIKRGK